MWVNAKGERVYDDTLCRIKDQSDYVEVLSMHVSENKATMMQESEGPKLDLDLKVYQNDGSTLFCAKEPTKWVQDTF